MDEFKRYALELAGSTYCRVVAVKLAPLLKFGFGVPDLANALISSTSFGVGYFWRKNLNKRYGVHPSSTFCGHANNFETNVAHATLMVPAALIIYLFVNNIPPHVNEAISVGLVLIGGHEGFRAIGDYKHMKDHFDARGKADPNSKSPHPFRDKIMDRGKKVLAKYLPK
jgi:hypothetical protein